MSPLGRVVVRIGSIADVVRFDLCIGCGLCEAVTGGRIRMTMNAAGSLRPDVVDGFTGAEEDRLLAACPGAVAEARADSAATVDEIWGGHRSMTMAWAADPSIRFGAATGGVLTALAVHLLRTGPAMFILHVGADPERPIRSRWVHSETTEDVIANSGSRYGPTAPLAGLGAALDRDQPFAVVGKPCDLGAIHRYASVDPRIEEHCIVRLALVCGGQSRLTKTLGLLDRFGLEEHDVESFRYRGNGNPGPTRLETEAGGYEVSYAEMWADESSWDVETRCKLCPDALGETADVAAADAWPGGAPFGEDDGFNTMIVRTGVGERLVADAVAAGDLVLGDPVTPRQLDLFQPHQVRKKEALAARFEGMVGAGIPPIETRGLRIRRLGERLGAEQWAIEREGTRRRLTKVST